MKPLVLGLTGSIGMGKSTTAAMFAEAGVPVWDADAAVSRLYAAGKAGSAEIAKLAPEAVGPAGVDRTVLRQRIAVDPSLLPKIEARIHPLVAADRKAFLDQHSRADLVLLDIPLLFEGNGRSEVDKVVVVSTSEEEQRRRVLARGTMDEATFEKLLARQMPDAEKRSRADHVIFTDTIPATQKRVAELIEQLRKERQENA